MKGERYEETDWLIEGCRLRALDGDWRDKLRWSIVRRVWRALRRLARGRR